MSFSVSSYPDSFIFTFLLEDFLPGRAKIEISAETCLFFVFDLFFRCCCLFVCFVFSYLMLTKQTFISPQNSLSVLCDILQKREGGECERKRERDWRKRR